jgi:hypothetical protein
MKYVCIIRYQIDPFQKEDFRKHGRNLIPVVPRCGGHFIGFMLPHEGTNDVAWALVGFDSLAAYEAYRARLKADHDGQEDAEWTARKRLILREERNFVEIVDGTFNLPPT